MRRLTRADLDSALNVLNRFGAGLYQLDHSYGGWRLEEIDGNGMRDVSPRMPLGECYRWIIGYTDGIERAVRVYGNLQFVRFQHETGFPFMAIPQLLKLGTNAARREELAISYDNEDYRQRADDAAKRFAAFVEKINHEHKLNYRPEYNGLYPSLTDATTGRTFHLPYDEA